MSNNRVFYSCYGIAKCGEPLIQGARSISISANKAFTNLYAPGEKDATATYSSLPDVTLSYSSYLKSIPALSSEPGINNYTGFDVAIGNDDAECITPKASMRFSYMFLKSITYKFSVEDFFTIDREYVGWIKDATCNKPGALSCNPEPPAKPETLVSGRRKYDKNSKVPSIVSFNKSSLQNITVTCNINRQYVQEFATRKPYASYVVFPVERNVVFNTLITDTLDSYNLKYLSKACKNNKSDKEDINIAVCEGGGSVDIPKAYFTNLGYNGADVTGGNLEFSLTFTSYESDIITKPVVLIPDSGSDCSCG